MDALNCLDGMVPNKIKGNLTIEREWEVARRLVSARRAKSRQAEAIPPAVGARAAAA